MTKLEQEIKFLKTFKKRFTTNQMYKAAIEDMWNEGIITPKAYDYIMNEFIPTGKGVMVKPNVVAKQAAKTIKKVEIDPCSHGGSYRSSC